MRLTLRKSQMKTQAISQNWNLNIQEFLIIILSITV